MTFHSFVLRWLPLSVVVSFGFAAAGCTTLPDVKPFADATAALTVAAGANYHDVADDVASLKVTRLELDTDATFETRKQSLVNTQAIFAATGKGLDQLFDAMTAYSEKLTSLTAAGKTGPDAAQSLFDSAKGFADLANVGGFPAGATANTIVGAFKAIADEFTKRQALKSLQDATAAAQPGVDAVAKQFSVIYGTAMRLAIPAIRTIRVDEASDAAGPSVLGFNNKVKRNYNAYYQYLIGVLPQNDPEHESAVGNGATADNKLAKERALAVWRGFCISEAGSCKAIRELEAVGLVEARMAAIHPIVETYEAKVTAIDDTENHRRKASAAVIKAVNAWSIEHQKLRQSLADGSSMSAFNLKAALIELDAILGQK